MYVLVYIVHFILRLMMKVCRIKTCECATCIELKLNKIKLAQENQIQTNILKELDTDLEALREYELCSFSTLRHWLIETSPQQHLDYVTKILLITKGRFNLNERMKVCRDFGCGGLCSIETCLLEPEHCHCEYCIFSYEFN